MRANNISERGASFWSEGIISSWPVVSLTVIVVFLPWEILLILGLGWGSGLSQADGWCWKLWKFQWEYGAMITNWKYCSIWYSWLSFPRRRFLHLKTAWDSEDLGPKQSEPLEFSLCLEDKELMEVCLRLPICLSLLPALLPGKSQGQRSLVGWSPSGR